MHARPAGPRLPQPERILTRGQVRCLHAAGDPAAEDLVEAKATGRSPLLFSPGQSLTELLGRFGRTRGLLSAQADLPWQGRPGGYLLSTGQATGAVNSSARSRPS